MLIIAQNLKQIICIYDEDVFTGKLIPRGSSLVEIGFLELEKVYVEESNFNEAKYDHIVIGENYLSSERGPVTESTAPSYWTAFCASSKFPLCW